MNMHVNCVPCGVKKPDIVKEILMLALWSLESEIFEKWSQIYTLDFTKFIYIHHIFVDRLNVHVQVFCKNSLFSKMYNVSQHNSLFSCYIM